MTSSPRTAPPRTGSPSPAPCPVDTALQVIGGRWKGSILWRLAEHGTMRPGRLRRSIPGVSEAVLLRQLHEMVADGVVERTEAKGYPREVSYRISTYGMTLAPVVEQLCAWGRDHQQQSAG